MQRKLAIGIVLGSLAVLGIGGLYAQANDK
jgi:hypothetical protein